MWKTTWDPNNGAKRNDDVWKQERPIKEKVKDTERSNNVFHLDVKRRDPTHVKNSTSALKTTSKIQQWEFD